MPDKRKNPKYDWALMKAEYVEKNITLAELAHAHDIPYSTLSKKSSKDNWAEARKEYSEKIAKKLSNRASNEQARHYMRLINSTDKLAARLEEAIEQEDQLYTYRGAKGEEERRTLLNTAHMRELIDLVREVNSATNEILGVLPRERIEEIELEKRRIAADAAAAEAERGMDGGSLGGVIVLPRINKADDGA